jgi:hypothetical protein
MRLYRIEPTSAAQKPVTGSPGPLGHQPEQEGVDHEEEEPRVMSVTGKVRITRSGRMRRSPAQHQGRDQGGDEALHVDAG